MTTPRFTAALLAALALAASAGAPAANAEPRDGQHDFDFEIGKWSITLKKLVHPLRGSHEWLTATGTSVTRPVWGGKANLEEFEVDMPAPVGHIEGMTVRTYSTDSHQWSIYWANQKNGKIDSIPMTGEFDASGHGLFYDQEDFDGRAIYVRFEWSHPKPNAAHFEQSFSTDGGKTWEVNWITDQTRVE